MSVAVQGHVYRIHHPEVEKRLQVSFGPTVPSDMIEGGVSPSDELGYCLVERNQHGNTLVAGPCLVLALINPSGNHVIAHCDDFLAFRDRASKLTSALAMANGLYGDKSEVRAFAAGLQTQDFESPGSLNEHFVFHRQHVYQSLLGLGIQPQNIFCRWNEGHPELAQNLLVDGATNRVHFLETVQTGITEFFDGLRSGSLTPDKFGNFFRSQDLEE